MATLEAEVAFYAGQAEEVGQQLGATQEVRQPACTRHQSQPRWSKAGVLPLSPKGHIPSGNIRQGGPLNLQMPTSAKGAFSQHFDF